MTSSRLKLCRSENHDNADCFVELGLIMQDLMERR